MRNHKKIKYSLYEFTPYGAAEKAFVSIFMCHLLVFRARYSFVSRFLIYIDGQYVWRLPRFRILFLTYNDECVDVRVWIISIFSCVASQSQNTHIVLYRMKGSSHWGASNTAAGVHSYSLTHQCGKLCFEKEKKSYWTYERWPWGTQNTHISYVRHLYSQHTEYAFTHKNAQAYATILKQSKIINYQFVSAI